MNVAIQLFTFNPTRSALNLLCFLNVLLKDASNTTFVWATHGGLKRTAKLKSLLGNNSGGIKLNDCYAQVSASDLLPELSGLKFRSPIVHLSISPTCVLWDSSVDTIRAGKPAVRKVISNAQSLERAAAFRGPAVMPTVLEITLVSETKDIAALLRFASESVDRGLPLPDSTEGFGVVDIGGEWLFFPKSGYNPNASDLHVYDCQEAQTDWEAWRLKHNMSFEFSANMKHEKPDVVTHSLDERQPAE